MGVSGCPSYPDSGGSWEDAGGLGSGVRCVSGLLRRKVFSWQCHGEVGGCLWMVWVWMLDWKNRMRGWRGWDSSLQGFGWGVSLGCWVGSGGVGEVVWGIG